MRPASIGYLPKPKFCATIAAFFELPDVNDGPMTPIKHDWQRRAEMALNTAIAGGHLITYAELADAAQIPAPHRIHQLTAWLETLIETDHKAAHRLRAAWVISRRRDQLPAPGFFMKCQEIGLYDGPFQGSEAASFHRQLLA